MSNPIRYTNFPSQPDYSGLQVAPDPVELSPEVVPGEEKIVSSYEVLKQDEVLYSPKKELPPVPDYPLTTKEKKRWPRKYYIIGAIAVIVIILAATLGGYFGSRKMPSKELDPSDNTNSTTTSTVSNEPTSLALDSSIWAVVWTTSDGGFVRCALYNAPRNGTLAYSMSTGSGAPDDSKWEQAISLEPQYPVANGAPIAISQLRQYAGDATYQLEVFYLNETHRVNGGSHSRAKGWGQLQDESQKIQQVWRNGGENRWETSTPDAFQDIAEWSKIASVTPPMWTNVEEQMRLASASDLTRCFSQRDGRLMEVQFRRGGVEDPEGGAAHLM
ncbi:unnamed protein product [Clonostachys rosea f. rosea IK726]|uniref:Uncharacterized protein n=1 Tax=Clonostachys rosea f. rosea IK726 TaxID=1349383 RepID=A0ACA9U0P5_BIOOC|nr:unnamed protein product [Clonostachys rosea f. rosea IK726]